MEQQIVVDEVLYYSHSSLTRIFDVSDSTIRRWKKNGLLPTPTIINGIERYSSRDIDALIKRQNPPRNRKSPISSSALKTLESR